MVGSVAAYNARRREENRLAWCEYHRDQAERHRAILEALIAEHRAQAESAERTSMTVHIYPSVLQALSKRGYAGCLETGVFRSAGVRLGTILDMNFREFIFHALR